jgi:hypothetical protein
MHLTQGAFILGVLAVALAGECLSYSHVEGMVGTFKKTPWALKDAKPLAELPLGS